MACFGVWRSRVSSRYYGAPSSRAALTWRDKSLEYGFQMAFGRPEAAMKCKPAVLMNPTFRPSNETAAEAAHNWD